MKSFRKLIALMLLAGFGVSFATVDAHSASFCDESTQVVQSQSTDSTHSDVPMTAPDCHCQGSANCQFDGAVTTEFQATLQMERRSSLVSSAFDSIFLDGLSRPPRAI